MANAVEMSTMRKLVAQLNRYRHEYYNLNAPSVADDVYDYMYDELLALEERTGVCMADSPTQTVGYPVVSALPKVAHDIPLLSLDKTKSIEDLIAFQAGRTVDLSLKLDAPCIGGRNDNEAAAGLHRRDVAGLDAVIHAAQRIAKPVRHALRHIFAVAGAAEIEDHIKTPSQWSLSRRMRSAVRRRSFRRRKTESAPYFFSARASAAISPTPSSTMLGR